MNQARSKLSRRQVFAGAGTAGALAAVATAMIDLSDGIATDAARLARASGTGAVVELEREPVAAKPACKPCAAAAARSPPRSRPRD